MECVKCVLIGDKAVGKTCLVLRFITGRFNPKPTSTIFENYLTILTVDECPIRLELWDTAFKDESKNLRILSYSYTDVFILCFSLVNHVSFLNVRLKWYPEIQDHCPNIPIILVGTKLDLRENQEAIDSQVHPISITYHEGVSMANAIGAVEYLECSALSQKGLTIVFEEAIRETLKKPKKLEKSHRSCNLI